MNKTIIININGIVFHIEEDAYEELRVYMIEVKKHFAYTPDSKEIVGDIENRIAEMFGERIVEGKKEVITMQDVEEVCAQMGKVSDFDNGEETAYTKEDPIDMSAFSGSRKLFRDVDNKIFGGVCSGLGYYLEVEAVWIRLAMVLLFAFAGTGFLLYIILWIVVPKVKTRADRMAMRGEAPNLHNFKKNFEEEMEGLRGNFTRAGESIRPGLSKLGDIIERFMSFIGKILILFLKAIGVLILASLCITLFGALLSIITIGFWGDGIAGLGPDGIGAFIEREYLIGGLIASLLVVAIPLMALIALAIRLLFNRVLLSNYMAFALLIVWFTAAGFVTFYSVKTAEDFVEDATVVKEQILVPFSEYHINIRDINTVKMIASDSVGKNVRLNKRRTNFKSNNRVQIEVLKLEPNEKAKIAQEFRAKGRDFDIASKRAENIIYQLDQENENLFFDSHSIIPKGELVRDQRVYIKFFIPVGTKLWISEESDRYLSNIPAWQCRSNFSENQRYESTHWVMTEEGLKCLSSGDTDDETKLETDTVSTTVRVK